MARVTINDIARVTGYSKTSVSFAFNDPERLSEAARTRILATARELGYIPDPVARNLTLRRHGTIGLLLPETISVAFLNSHLSQIVQGIGEVCERENHSLTLIPPKRESVLEGVRSAAVDGLITIGLEPGMETVEIINHRTLPFVTIDGRAGGGFPVVGIDDEKAAAELMGHVLSLGHRRIAIVSFFDEPQLAAASQVKAERLSGYRVALEAAGLDMPAPPGPNPPGPPGSSGPAPPGPPHAGEPTQAGPPAVTIWECESSISGGREAAERILGAGSTAGAEAPTAIVAMSDVIALGVTGYLADHGRAVPEEFTVVGFDGIPEADLTRPQLTTVSQSGFDKGHVAADTLVKLIEGEDVEQQVVLEAELLVRGSSGPPRA